MGNLWKPEGYPSVSPYLVVADARREIEFLQQVFDAPLLRSYDRPDGTIMHAELRIGDTVVMLGEATAAWKATASQLHVYVPDVGDVYRRAVNAGGVTVQEPVRKAGDPDRRGGFQDPAGNTWWVATQEAVEE